jgi:hypothetical protein
MSGRLESSSSTCAFHPLFTRTFVDPPLARLYHYNPWTDTAEGACSSFELYRKEPISFFMQRFAGMTLPVARFLATRVFCILGDSSDDSPRVSAEEFSVWAKDLPVHFSVPGHARAISISSTQGHPLASGLPPSRPASRQASINNTITRRGSRSASRPPSFAHGFVETELSTVLDNDNEGEVHEEPREEEIRPNSRTSSTMKRRKRGARKNKGKEVQAEQVDVTLETLAEASQTLAREISRSSKASANGFVIDPVPPVPPIPSDSVPPTPTITKKPSKWKLIIGKSNGERSPTVPTPSPAVEEKQMSSTTSNVTDLLLALSRPPPKSPSSPRQQTPTRHGPMQSTQPFDDSTHARGRRKNSPYGNNGGIGSQSHIEKWADSVEKRGISPTSTRSARYPASSASSMASTNWRSSISTTNSTRSPNNSSLAFTKYSNNSASTVATSMSSGSWRNTNGSKYSVNSGHHSYRNGNIPPPNVKRMCVAVQIRSLSDRHLFPHQSWPVSRGSWANQQGRCIPAQLVEYPDHYLLSESAEIPMERGATTKLPEPQRINWIRYLNGQLDQVWTPLPVRQT